MLNVVFYRRRSILQGGKARKSIMGAAKRSGTEQRLPAGSCYPCASFKSTWQVLRYDIHPSNKYNMSRKLKQCCSSFLSKLMYCSELFLLLFLTPLWMFVCDDVVRTGLKLPQLHTDLRKRKETSPIRGLAAISIRSLYFCSELNACYYGHMYIHTYICVQIHTLLHTKAVKEAAISSPWFLFVQRGTGNCKCDQFYSTIADISYLCSRKVIIWKKSVNMLNVHLYVLCWAISPSLDFPSVHLGVQTKQSKSISKDLAIIIEWTWWNTSSVQTKLCNVLYIYNALYSKALILFWGLLE